MPDHAGAKVEKEKISVIGLVIFAASMLSNILVNSFLTVGLYSNPEFFSLDPKSEFLETCPLLPPLQEEILDIQAFFLPMFTSYCLIDVVSDFLLGYGLVKKNCSPVVVPLKLVNMVLFLYVGVYYFFVSENLDKRLLCGFCVSVALKIGFTFCTMLRKSSDLGNGRLKREQTI